MRGTPRNFTEGGGIRRSHVHSAGGAISRGPSNQTPPSPQQPVGLVPLRRSTRIRLVPESSKPSLMDVVFDRASLCIMESQVDRQRYAKLMKSVLAPAYTYVLITFKHDDQSYKGENTTLKKLSELQEITVPGIKSPVIEVTWLMTG
ncbi:hypothetical protein HPB49_003361 [Dermacentor silvarum]|uniref:Uncharacterized protein n=1 Tax=Dermacentor silvarum TaxID=543639 RepID=A0ACB8DTY9_DERSI|nr:hypothetical protein HPB49_003361 [Dermacentor silvarum]